jgi:hypothetical protein
MVIIDLPLELEFLNSIALEIDFISTYKFCVKYWLSVITKIRNVETFWVYVKQIWHKQNIYLSNKLFQKKKKKKKKKNNSLFRIWSYNHLRMSSAR